MTVATETEAPRTRSRALPLALRLALRDLRGGVAGFWIFLVCIALGTGAIGAINGLSGAIRDALARDATLLLGGDVEATLIHRQANTDERAFLESVGRVSEVATMRAMARRPDANAQALVDLKAVDGAYPLYGTVTMEEGKNLDAVRRGGLAVDRTILDQLGLKLGDEITLGKASFPVVAVLGQEPDRFAAGPAFGARILMSSEALRATGIAEPGALVRWAYRIKVEGGAPPTFKAALSTAFPEAGFLLRDTSDPTPGIRNTLDRLAEFLTLVGLTAMLTGGIGVANAVSAFVERRRRTIATFKALGASQRTIFHVFLIEMALFAALGILIGFGIALAVPWLVAGLASALLPVSLEPGFQPEALGLAALFGALTALPFILWPLGRAQQVRAAELFRNGSEDAAWLPPRAYRYASLGAVALLAASAILLSQNQKIAAATAAALFAVFVLFWFIGAGIRRFAARLPRPKRPEVALALANIAGPASLARTIALSLGAGLTLLTAVSLVDASLTNELKTRLPEHAPSYFFIGIPKQSLAAFEDLLEEKTPDARIATAPMLRGRLVALKGVPVEQIKAPSSAEWVLNGDRGITYSDAVPSGSQITEGAWWPADHNGEALVSFEAEIGKALGLAVGDMVTVNVLGRNLQAKIANFRSVKWGSIDINFVMIFSPNALKAAPFTWLATLSWPEGKTPDAKGEAEVMKAVAGAYPSVSAVRVRDALAAFNGVFEKIMTAVRAAGSITLIMGALVVAGALLTAQRRRIYEAVVLRTLGASKRRVITAHLLEYLMLAACLSAVAAALGLLAAWVIVKYVMGLTFVVSLSALLQPSAIETIFVTALGALGTFKVLSAKPAQYLRSE
ncbi:ABC transporter permease [Rhodomicrobium sp.]|uniref:ABC transporter permease n=1 Tax=Rhodomicrobium sp. TaxID=2720632 RepID=UPI0039E719FB